MDRKAYQKLYYLKNKEKMKAKSKANYHENREKIKEQRKEYYQANIEYVKEYYQANIDKIKEYQKTPNRKKSNTISDWKRRGLISEDYDALYDRYLESTNCEECDCEYGKIGDGSGTWKCMDHNHQTGLFRNFLCCACNLKRG